MRPLSTLIALAALAVSLRGQSAGAPPASIHAGPVYTRGPDGGASPQYPDLQIQVEVPPTADQSSVSAGAFSVKADNGSSAVATRLQSLASTRYGMAVSVTIDVSGSMKGAPLNAVRSGLTKFVADADPEDKIAIQTVADDGRWEVSWENSRADVRSALVKLDARGSLTRLWDGLFDAIEHFPATPLCQRIIVISDGHDEGSSHTEQDVIAAAQQRHVLIDAVGLTRSNPVYLQGLAQLASQTGGQFREARNNEELDRLVSSGIQRLKNTPVLSFRLDGLPADGTSHRLQVIWNHDGTVSQAEVAFTLPLAIPLYMRHVVWAGSGAAVLLLAVLIVLAFKRRPEQHSTGVPVPEPVAPRKVFPTPYDTVGHRISAKTKMIARFPVPSPEKPTAWLICEQGFAPGQKFAVTQAEFWIGALENNHLRIADDPTVSGNHACLIFEHEVLGVYDYKSTNGTRVNGERVTEKRHLLRPGDRIQVGRSTFTIQLIEREGAGL